MKILLIGNRGKFINFCYKEISNFYDVDLIEIDKTSVSNLVQYLYSILNSIEYTIYDYIVYISGETIDEDYMNFLNYRLPSELVDKAISAKVPFLYLSSLAIYAGHYEDKITTKMEMVPIDTYGFTKSLFDNYVLNLKKEKTELKIKRIIPASIYSGNGRSSIEKYDVINKKFNVIFKIFSFNGCLSYIERQEITDTIIMTINNNDFNCKILSKNKYLNNKNLFFQIYKPPILFFKFLGIFNYKFSLNLRILLRGIKYE